MSGRFHRALAFGAVLALGCSDPVPPAARGGVRLNVTGTGACPAGQAAPIRSIGNPGPNSEGPEGKGGPIADGEQGVRATCSVTGGPEFSVTAGIKQGPISFTLLDGRVSGTTAQGTATISVQTTDILGVFTSDPGACTLTAVTTQRGIQVISGAMWAKFNCPTIKGQLATEVCKVQGDVVVENCN
jgi:hypothetical protein